MKIAHVHIKHFRAIRTSDFRVGTILALVGQNNAGKSSVLRALNAFFNFEAERDTFMRGGHSFQKTSVAEVDLEFTDAPTACTLPRVKAGHAKIRVRLRYKKLPTWQVFTNGSWTQAPADLHAQLGMFIRYVYVPLRRDHEVAGWGDRGLLQSAVEAWVRNHTRNRDRISPKVAALGKMIQQRAFKGLSTQLRKVTPIAGGFTFQLDYSKSPDYGLLLRDLVLRVTEGTTTVDLEECGSGTQGMTAFALHSYLAEAGGSTYVIGIEEPEQNLHPQAQREMLATLRKLPLQVLFSTHSTVMLDGLSHDEVVLCRRATSATRGVEVNTTQLSPTFWSSSKLDEQRYVQFHRRRNSEFFFANFVILTESPIDSELLRDILDRTGGHLTTNAVSILSLDGAASLPYAYHLLRALQLPFAVVLDKDYFLPYLNDELDKSRDSRGFPRYRRSYHNGTLVDAMVPDPHERAQLLSLLHTNHSRAMNILEKRNVFCFKWSLEVDLVNSATARKSLFQHFTIPLADQTTTALLVDRKNALKKLETLLPVLQALQPSNLPNSYKRLRRVLPVLIRTAAGQQ